MSVLIHHGDEPALPASPRHHLAVPELAREHHRLLTRRGVARQVHSFRIVQAFLPIVDVKVVTRVAAPGGKACLRYTLSAAAANRPLRLGAAA